MNVMPSHKYGFKDLDIINCLFLILTPIAAVVSTFYWLKLDGFHWGQVLFGIFMYFLTGLSITAGYHRLFAHKAYEASAVVKIFFLLFGAAAFQNSVTKWASDHRRHHLEVDTEEDPYSITEGFFHAHMGWIFLKKNGTVIERFAKDFRKDPLIIWQNKYYMLIAGLVGIILPTVIGGVCFDSYLGGLAVGGFCRIVLTHHCTFFINSLCHYIGSAPYTDSNSAKDSWIMALFTFGEGYHNFHHYFQADYRNGIRWYHFDPTKWLIKLMNMMGIASRLKLTPQDKIVEAQMQMKLKNIQHKWQPSEKVIAEVERLKTQVLEAMARVGELKKEYKLNKDQFGELARQEFKLKIAQAKLELKHCREQWEFLMNHGRVVYAQA